MNATYLVRGIRSALHKQPLLRSAYAALRPAYWALRAEYRALRAVYQPHVDRVGTAGASRDPLDPWRMYRFIDTTKHADKLKSGSSYRPLTLQCETVNVCNNLCVICAYPQEARQRAVMPMEVFEKVLHDYSQMGGGYMSMTPVTGDILLDKYLLQRLERIRCYPRIREIGVTTNAVMLDRFTDDEVRTIVNAFGKLQISIYGLDEEEYVAMTKRNTYHRAIDAVRRILAVRQHAVFLSFRLLKPHARKTIDDWVLATFGYPVGINSVMTGDYANFVALDTAKPLPFGSTWAQEPPKKTQCLIPLLAVQISSNGSVAFCACVGGVEGLVLGNIKDHTLLELYNTPKVRALWNWAEAGVPDACSRCTFYAPLENVRGDPTILDNPFAITGA